MPTSKTTPDPLRSNFYPPLPQQADSSNAPALDDEIALLRAMIRRTMQLAEGIGDLREATRVLDALGAATNRLAVLLRVQNSLQERKTILADEISDAIQQVNSELRSKK